MNDGDGRRAAPPAKNEESGSVWRARSLSFPLSLSLSLSGHTSTSLPVCVSSRSPPLTPSFPTIIIIHPWNTRQSIKRLTNPCDYRPTSFASPRPEKLFLVDSFLSRCWRARNEPTYPAIIRPGRQTNDGGSSKTEFFLLYVCSLLFAFCFGDTNHNPRHTLLTLPHILLLFLLLGH